MKGKHRIFDLPSTMSLDQFVRDHHWTEVSDQETGKFFKALHLAVRQHWNQTRSCGEIRYSEHLLVVADALHRLNFDVDIQIAGLLHDIEEDCGVPGSEIESLFGAKVARLVDALTKRKGVDYWEQLYKSTSENYETIFIKLIDRWHNLATAYGFRDYDRQVRFLEETLGPLRELVTRCLDIIPKEHVSDFVWLSDRIHYLAEGMYKGLTL